MAGELLAHLRQQWIGVIALLLVLTGGTAYALDGSNTVFTDDLVNGDVKVADIGQGAVATDEIANSQVKAADIGDGEVKSADIANGQVTADELAANSVRSDEVADGQVRTQEIGNGQVQSQDLAPGVAPGASGARAFGLVSGDCASGPLPTLCSAQQSKGISTVTREATGLYCVIAPGLNGQTTPAAVTVDQTTTSTPDVDGHAMTTEGGICGPRDRGFVVTTQRPSGFADNIGFTIVIP